jgi:RNA polymerase sigma-70 factor (ECF subfamily)
VLTLVAIAFAKAATSDISMPLNATTNLLVCGSLVEYHRVLVGGCDRAAWIVFYRIGTTDLPGVTNAADEFVMRHSIPNMAAKAEAIDNFASSNLQPRISGRLREYLQRIARAQSAKHNELDHSDVVQQTLLEAHLAEMKGNAPQHPCHYRHWLRRILLCNLADAVRHCRRQKRDVRRVVQFTDKSGGSTSAPALDQLATDLTSPSQACIRNERADLLRQALAGLPQINRDVVRMRFFERRNIPEIAEAIGRSDRAVAGLLFRSLQTLKEDLVECSDCSKISG